MVYTNTLGLADMINDLVENQQKLINTLSNIQTSIYPKSLEDSVDLSTNVDEISTKLDTLTRMFENNEDDKNEMNIDLSQIQATLLNIKSRIDNLLLEKERDA
jgi:hypothetical protein